MKTIKAYENAIFEAERFIKRARLAVAVMKTTEYYYMGKETASAKRSSMDLTKALVEVRKPITR